MDLTFLFLMAGASLYTACATSMLAALRHAPEGYEDETGFHAEPKKV